MDESKVNYVQILNGESNVKGQYILGFCDRIPNSYQRTIEYIAVICKLDFRNGQMEGRKGSGYALKCGFTAAAALTTILTAGF